MKRNHELQFLTRHWKYSIFYYITHYLNIATANAVALKTTSTKTRGEKEKSKRSDCRKQRIAGTNIFVLVKLVR